jgi:phage baseplate assembly protein W
MPKLTDPSYLAFPLRIGREGPLTARREAHVREQIEQVLFTAPGERVFRHEFGAGVKRLVFEPYTEALQEVTRKRLSSALTDVLLGEVDPKTLDVGVVPAAGAAAIEGEQRLAVSYRLATINREETHTVLVGTGDSGG